jgi:hypothetical protein
MTQQHGDTARGCGTCRFYRNQECHAAPPVRLPRKFGEKATPGNRVRDEALIFGWPLVRADDWCGHWSHARVTCDMSLSDADLKAQALRCGCRGSDDYCVCQNVPDRVTMASRRHSEGK